MSSLGKRLIGVETLSLHVIKLRESKTTYHTCIKAWRGGIPTKCERRPKQHEENATNNKKITPKMGNSNGKDDEHDNNVNNENNNEWKRCIHINKSCNKCN